MKNKQDIQLELLQEIDDICSKNNLKYTLFGINALNGYLNNTIKNGSRMVAIAMTYGDIDRFCKIITEKYENRYVEGIFNNPRFNGLYITYGNKNTTDLNIRNLNYNHHHGIRIRIYPIRKSEKLDGTQIKEFNSKLEKEKKIRELLNKRIENKKLWYLKTGINTLNIIYKLSRGEKNYYKKIKKNGFINKWDDIQNYSKVRINKTEISTKYLKELEKYEIDGINLYLPKNTDNFFEEIYGENFNEKKIKPKPEKMYVITNTEISYKEILEELKGEIKEIRSEHEEIIWERRKFINEKTTVANVWHLVKMTNKQIQLKEYYDKNVDSLLSLNLNDEEEFNKIDKELEPIIKTLEKYSKKGMTFSINPKVDELIEKVLIKKGNLELLNKIKKIREKEYFIE